MMEDDDGLDCLDLLEETPGILRGLMRELSHEDADWKPAPGRFSVAEVLAHLSHSEGHCYRMRVDRFLSEELPEFESDDAQMYLDLYKDADAEDSFDHFEEQRDTNVEFLRTLPRSAGERRALHKVAGEITLQQMLHEWAMHDLGHIRQIAELVRARKHRQASGPAGGILYAAAVSFICPGWAQIKQFSVRLNPCPSVAEICLGHSPPTPPPIP